MARLGCPAPRRHLRGPRACEPQAGYRVMRLTGFCFHATRVAPTNADMTARSPSHSRTSAGARTASRSHATMPKRCASPLRSIAVTAKLWAISRRPKASREKMFATSWSRPSNSASDQSIDLPATIERLTDDGSCYIAGETRKFAREIGFEPSDDPRGNPTIEWNGRGFRAYDQT